MEARGFLATGSCLLKDTQGDGCQCHRESAPTAPPLPSCGDLGFGRNNDIFPGDIELDYFKTGKPPGFFKLFSTWVWKILFPDRKFDSHFIKSMRTWLNCIITTHKRALSRNGLFQCCPLQHEENSTLVFKHSCYMTLSNLVDFIFLRQLFGSCLEA